MKKPKKIRGCAPLKVIAFLLAWALAAGACAFGGGALYLFVKQRNYSDNVTFDNMALSQEEELETYLFLHLYQNALTEEGRSCYQSLKEKFSAQNTNFRFQVTDSGGQSVLATDLDSTFSRDREEEIGEMIATTYSLGECRMISYYLDLNRTSDWELREGTTQEWANQPNASCYYYDPEDIARADGNYPGYCDVYDEDEDVYDEDEWEEYTTRYCYYVFAGNNRTYTVSFGLDGSYPIQDWYSSWEQDKTEFLTYYDEVWSYLTVAGASCLGAFALILTFLTLAIGWNRQGELALRGINRLPVEVVLVGAGGLVLLAAVMEMDWPYGSVRMVMLYGGVAGSCGALGALALWLTVAAQIKTHTLLRRSLVWRIGRWIWKGCISLIAKVRYGLAQWQLYRKVAVFCVAYWLFYLLYVLTIGTAADQRGGLVAIVAFTLPLIPLAAITCKWAVDWARLRQSVREMVGGTLECTIDTSHMFPDLRAHGDDLSNLSAGLSKALNDRLKSERFKTELITNVSHDLKTPLTSIINYVDLLKQLDIQDEKAKEYLDVLDRKSQRLKTLTEDLVEASKAATGTIAVQLERLDVIQLVNQAVGEYNERLEQAGLTPVVTVPPTACTVMADGRHLWRILDNLLGNCTKYAMPGTRVYLDVTRTQNSCTVAVKNISADPLNVPAEELLKRFVRGDSARSTEGSGLGLSIARNLTNAQGGSFDLVVDGDLFKAVVTFPLALYEPIPVEQDRVSEPEAAGEPEKSEES